MKNVAKGQQTLRLSSEEVLEVSLLDVIKVLFYGIDIEPQREVRTAVVCQKLDVLQTYYTVRSLLLRLVAMLRQGNLLLLPAYN